MKKIITLFTIFATIGFSSLAQIESTKKGDIEFNGKRIVELEKFGGSAEVRPKFRVYIPNSDTIILINFNKLASYDWMTFNFKTQKKVIEINSSEIINGLNYQKNIGAFIVKKELFDSSGILNDSKFQELVSSYSENLTEIYKKRNIVDQKINTSILSYNCTDKGVYINNKLAGYVSLRENLNDLTGEIEFKDIKNETIVKGNFNGLGVNFIDKKGKSAYVSLTEVQKSTVGCSNTTVIVNHMFRQLCQKYYFNDFF